VIVPILLARPGGRTRAAAGAASFYPLFLLLWLYATWFTAWLVLGHRPRSSLDDPKSISALVDVPYAATALLLLGGPFLFLVWIPLMLVDTAQSIWRKEVRPGRGVARMVIWMVAPLSVWLAFFVVIRWDLLGVRSIVEWYMD
jgi:hypothetical protein